MCDKWSRERRRWSIAQHSVLKKIDDHHRSTSVSLLPLLHSDSGEWGGGVHCRLV